MITRRPYSRTATRRADRLKIRENPAHQPGRLNDKLSPVGGSTPTDTIWSVVRFSINTKPWSGCGAQTSTETASPGEIVRLSTTKPFGHHSVSAQ
jgi:hypothetical protein